MKPPYQNLVTPYTQLNLDSCALLVIDTQNDFGDHEGAHPMPDLEQVMPKLVKAIEVFREAGKLIVHVVRLYKEDGSNVDLCRRWHFQQGELSMVVPGTWGAELVAGTNPTGAKLDPDALLAGEFQELTPKELVMYKPRFSAFHNTPLKELLDSKGIDSVVIVGITFSNCVRATQFGATDNGYRVGLVPSACTGVNDEELMAMQAVGVQLITPDDLKSRFGG
jgi:nicotinamidase-related amidase